MRFDPATAERVCRESYAPLSDAGNCPPRVFFEVDPERPTRMTATPPGARIECVLLSDCDSDSSIVRIATSEHRHIADVTVRTGSHVGHEDITTETIAIASALYWSWWRGCDMRRFARRMKRTAEESEATR